MTNLPRSLDAIDEGWLTRALQERYPGVVVTRAEGLRTIAGTATKRLYGLEYNEAGRAAGLPPTMWIKGGFDPGHFDLFADTLVYMTEGRFFRELAGELDVRLPKCFYADYDERQGIVLMEDLAVEGVEFCRSTRRVSVDLVAASNSNLARLHARWWGSPQLDRWDWIQMPLQEDTGLQYFRTTSNPDQIARRLASHRGALVPREVQEPDAIYGSMLKLVPLIQRKPHCLLHADPHIGNVYFSQESGPGFVDFQQVRKGYWAFDYTYHVVSALDAEDRRRHEVTLLRNYLDELAELGADAPDFDGAWLDYRRNVAYGLIAWICNPEFCQPEDINVATAARFAAAAADLETFRSF
jgi:hypothetical protein